MAPSKHSKNKYEPSDNQDDNYQQQQSNDEHHHTSNKVDNKEEEENNNAENKDKVVVDNSPKIIPVAKLPERLKKNRIVMNISDTQYPILEEIAEDLNWDLQKVQGNGDWDVWWTDREVNPDILYRMNLHQKINHFPGISTLARKNQLALNLGAMKDRYPAEYDFFPETWSIPLQFPLFRQYYQSHPDQTYIVKPQALSQGRGIFLTRNIQQILNGRKYVIQRYVESPMLIQGLKFDLRIYVLLKSVYPLEVYIYDEGLVRLATMKYQKVTQKNMKRVYMHLTNYSLNKKNPSYQKNEVIKALRSQQEGSCKQIPKQIEGSQTDRKQNGKDNLSGTAAESLQKGQDEDEESSLESLDSQQLQQLEIGHKRSLNSFWIHLQKQHSLSQLDIEKLKQKVNDLIIKTIISGYPSMLHQYKYCQPELNQQTNMCFHILGFDVMFDEQTKPIIIQINHTPSFETSSDLDYRIKKNLIMDTLRIMQITQKNKKKLFKKAKQVAKKRLQVGRKQVYENLTPTQKNNKNINKNKLEKPKKKVELGGFKKIYPIQLKQEQGQQQTQQLKQYKQERSSQYNKLIEHATLVHKQCSQTRKKMIKQEQEKKKQRGRQDKQKQKQKQKDKDKQKIRQKIKQKQKAQQKSKEDKNHKLNNRKQKQQDQQIPSDITKNNKTSLDEHRSSSQNLQREQLYEGQPHSMNIQSTKLTNFRTKTTRKITHTVYNHKSIIGVNVNGINSVNSVNGINGIKGVNATNYANGHQNNNNINITTTNVASIKKYNKNNGSFINLYKNTSNNPNRVQQLGRFNQVLRLVMTKQTAINSHCQNRQQVNNNNNNNNNIQCVHTDMQQSLIRAQKIVAQRRDHKISSNLHNNIGRGHPTNSSNYQQVINNSNYNENESAKKLGGFLVPKTYEIVDGRNKVQYIPINNNNNNINNCNSPSIPAYNPKLREFSQLMTSIQGNHDLITNKIKPNLDPQIILNNKEPNSNSSAYKKKIRYSII